MIYDFWIIGHCLKYSTVICCCHLYGLQVAFWFADLIVILLNYGLFAPKTIRSGAKVPSVELSLPGTFAPWNFRSLVLSKRMEDGAKVRNRERKLTIC